MTSRKGGFFCIYRGCYSRTGEGLSFFSIPNDSVRAEVWLKNCNRLDLVEKNTETLHKNHKLCELHFEGKHISKSGIRKTLFHEAFPTVFSHLKHKNQFDFTEEPSKKLVILEGNTTSFSQEMVPAQSEGSNMKTSSQPQVISGDHLAIEMEKMDASMDMSTETSCRACANTCVQCYNINSKICNFSATIKDMMVLLVPQMEPELEDYDVICNICRKTLINCVRFIDKCLSVEAVRKNNGLCQKSSLDTAPITILEDGVIKKEEEHLSDVEKKYTNCSSLNGDCANDEETEEVINIKIENDHGINNTTLQNDLVEALPSSILDHNRLISAAQMCTDELNEFIHILASNDVRTIQLAQDSKKQRVILIGSTFKCGKCSKYFDLRSKYTRHLEMHRRVEQRHEKRERLRKLRIQKLEERKAQKLGKQMNGSARKQRRKPPVNLECETCSEKLSSIEDLELHLRIHPPFVCEKCGKRFAKKTQIQAHKFVHNERNSYVCEVCGKGCKTTSQLRQHALGHENTAHSCNKCQKVFSGSIRLKSHLRNTHGEGRTKTWACKECAKIFKRSSLHHAHYRQMHLRDGDKKCDICGQGFYRTDYLTRHKRRHIIYGETRESLNNDGTKSQTNESALNGTENDDRRRFIRMPPGPVGFKRRVGPLPPGPYQCQICMKLYKKVDNLKRHILSHGKARFSCKACSRTFKIKYLLTRHEKVHEKSDLSLKYRCEICWKRFEIQDDLDRHFFTHTNLKHKCELCEQSFAREHLLNDHIANVHAEDDDEEEEMRLLMTKGLGTTLYNLINI